MVTAPAPWQLKGRGYILAVRLPALVLKEQSFIDKALQATRRGPLAYVMFVDYESSNVGPYRELLFIPGSLQFSDGRYLSVSKIYVSAEASVVNGRANWGIPKERCDFGVRYGDDGAGGADQITLMLDGHILAELKFRQRRSCKLPFNTGWLPKRWVTLAQQLGGREFHYAPAARGSIKPARLLASNFNSALFPDISQGRVVACVKVTGFEMTFPLAETREL
ncbi:MAG TPA: acetoacetate decarboxylase family protein [Burkholderiaceae bacterium]